MISREQRHTKAHRCPVCDGAEGDPRGKEKRCTGFTTDDGYAHCSREGFAGAIAPNGAGLYAHRLRGSCKCGTQHGPDDVARDEIEATYPYVDERGELLFEVVRKTGKQFRQRKPDGAGGWDWKLNGVRRVPFRLPELIASDPDAPVLVCEGEKDVETAVRMGFVATCNPGGAEKWLAVAETAAKVLRGRRVCVVADADEPGRRHARQVVASLRGIASAVGWSETPAKDLTAWVSAGATAADVWAWVDYTLRTDRPEGDEEPSAGPTPWLTTIGPAEIFAELPEPVYVSPGLQIGPGRVTMLAGHATAGKTVIVQSMALSVAAGRPIWGVFSSVQGRVLHLDGEIGQYLARQRYHRLGRAMGVGADDLGDRLRMANYPEIALDSPGIEDKLCSACEGFALVILDSLTAFGGDVDQNTSEVGRLLYMLARVSARTGATVMILHHLGKPSRNGDAPADALHAIRGSSAIAGSCESIFLLAGQRGEAAQVHHLRTPTGTLLPSFGLHIEDRMIDGVPRAGLAVRHIGADELERDADDRSEAIKRQSTARAVEQVLSKLREHAGVFHGSRKALREAIGMRDVALGAALVELTKSGRVVHEGTYHKPVYRLLSGSTPDPLPSTTGADPDDPIDHPLPPPLGGGVDRSDRADRGGRRSESSPGSGSEGRAEP